MSADLYTHRIYWDTSRGCAKAPGVYRHLTRAPDIPGLPSLSQIDYAPATQTYRLQPINGGWADMELEHIQACRAWLLAIEREAAA